ncbi:CLUMA_CG001647, isoform A [Clunio marinus]|uniref:CLUMA_CG001647, isoform A n=1 Tax=Clunio marinus TaxID=568069 RepID=A0A1J1HKC3_9DIPT|nr:CLUMA_CG001647, isoform A [Clunio marinus]
MKQTESREVDWIRSECNRWVGLRISGIFDLLRCKLSTSNKKFHEQTIKEKLKKQTEFSFAL